MLDKVTKQTFAAHIGETFLIEADTDHTFTAELTEVKSLPSPQSKEDGVKVSNMRQEPFSLLFRVPSEAALPQRMYTVAHDEMGQLESIFLVPVGMDEDGRYYEAVFN